MLSLTLALATLLSHGGPTSAEDDLRDAYDVLSYDIELEVSPGERSIEGSVTVRARVVAEELDVFVLDLVDEMTVQGVSSRGATLEHEHADDRIVVQLPESRAKGDELVVSVAYGGEPQARDSFTGFHWAKTADGRPWINTSCQGPGAHSWWPCKSSFYNPEDKPERVSMAITVPGDLYAVSNGRLAGVDELADGRKRYRWRHGYPLETYTVTLNVAPYVVVETELELRGVEKPVPFVYYVLPENAEKAKVQFAQVPELIDVFSRAFGPWPFPDAKFGLVETNFWGMEHSTAVAYGSSYPAWCKENGEPDRYAARNRYFDYILVHEVAHEWWGNAVSTTNWGDFWIHEGFGTYAEGVYIEFTQGREVADEYFRGQGRRMPRTGKLYRGAESNSGQAYSGLVYSKGACVLNTLRHYVDDDEAWWKALREFNLRHRYGNAGTDDFRAVLEEVTGREWKRFFDSWVYGEGQPSVKGEVSAEGSRIQVAIENEGSGATGFQVPLDLVWSVGGVEQTRRLMLEPGETATVLDAGGEVEGLRVVHLDRVLGQHDVEVR